MQMDLRLLKKEGPTSSAPQTIDQDRQDLANSVADIGKVDQEVANIKLQLKWIALA